MFYRCTKKKIIITIPYFCLRCLQNFDHNTAVFSLSITSTIQGSDMTKLRRFIVYLKQFKLKYLRKKHYSEERLENFSTWYWKVRPILKICAFKAILPSPIYKRNTELLALLRWLVVTGRRLKCANFVPVFVYSFMSRVLLITVPGTVLISKKNSYISCRIAWSIKLHSRVCLY